ncbi:hypothetical protein [Rhizobium chutanense]|nr:hypothetical protein [Rhizobium chutanense]
MLTYTTPKISYVNDYINVDVAFFLLIMNKKEDFKMHLPKAVIRSAPLLSGAVILGILFGHPISDFLAHEGAILGDLRLMQAQASLAVLQHAIGAKQDSAKTDLAPSATPAVR